jgi:hypothetical protein
LFVIKGNMMLGTDLATMKLVDDPVKGIRLTALIYRLGGAISSSRSVGIYDLDDGNSTMQMLKYSHGRDDPFKLSDSEWKALDKMPAQGLIAGYAGKFPFMLAITGLPKQENDENGCYESEYFDQIVIKISEKILQFVSSLQSHELQESHIDFQQVSQGLIELNRIEYPEVPWHGSFAIMYGKEDQYYCAGFAFQEVSFTIQKENDEPSNLVTSHESPDGDTKAPVFFNQQVAPTDTLCGCTEGIGGSIKLPEPWLIRALEKSRDECASIVARRKFNRRRFPLGSTQLPDSDPGDVTPQPCCSCTHQ